MAKRRQRSGSIGKKCDTDGFGKLKTKYARRIDAEKAMTFIWGNDSSIAIGDLHVYVCPKCGKFHVGHDRDAIRKKRI